MASALSLTACVMPFIKEGAARGHVCRLSAQPGLAWAIWGGHLRGQLLEWVPTLHHSLAGGCSCFHLHSWWAFGCLSLLLTPFTSCCKLAVPETAPTGLLGGCDPFP